MKLLALLFAALLPAAAQSTGKAPAEEEQRLLQEAVSQVGNSPVEFIRAVERYLRLHPDTRRRADLEKAVLRAAVDAKDNARILSYGERALERDDDPTLLDRVARALLASDDAASARRSLKYSERLEKAVAKSSAGPGRPGELPEDPDRLLARAQVLQARAWGNTGDLAKAIALARQSYETFPNAEAANEAARWEMKLGRKEAALDHYADAFAIPDPKVTEDDRRHYRTVMGELYTKIHGSEAGLGELALKAYDRTAAALRAREAAAKPSAAGNVAGNTGLLDAFEFRLSGLRGDSIRLADYSGKVLVLDIWATWCVPCRFLHPLLDQVRTKYKGHPDVVFLSINADQDRALVKPFVEQLKWSNEVYFEDGLGFFYRITSIPTTLIFNKRKELVSRLDGFSQGGYVEMLTERIEAARKE